ncbi:MAG TPA: D-2-hydroxyacid dehydrogenase [Niallia sp.]|nr:D-2-hydroxyacid dehydrogenase [Niallia sp.]
MIVSTVTLKEDILLMVKERTGEDIICCSKLTDLSPEQLALVEVLISKNEFFEESTLDLFPNLKFLYVMSAGVDNLPFHALRKREVIVCNASGIHGKQMCEHAIGVMISFTRDIGTSIRNQVKKQWGPPKRLDELSGKTLVIIGAGRIGQEIAKAASFFGMQVIGLKRTVEALEHFDAVLGMDKIYEAFGQADFIILVTPLTKDTVNLIGKDEFAAMKHTAIFINLSRGETVDEESLILALKNGSIAGAGLDVFRNEPLPSESELWEMENVIITPHIAGITHNYVEKSIAHFVKNLLLYKNGQELLSPVNLNECY